MTEQWLSPTEYTPKMKAFVLEKSAILINALKRYLDPEIRFDEFSQRRPKLEPYIDDSRIRASIDSGLYEDVRRALLPFKPVSQNQKPRKPHTN